MCCSSVDWVLKLGRALQSAVQDTVLANLYTSVLINCLPFIRSWGGLLLSCAAWMNMGLDYGHSGPVTLRAAHRALTRVIASTPHDVESSRKCTAFVIPHLPTNKASVACLKCIWLQHSAHWNGYKYASFYVLHSGFHSEWCADWNYD